MTASLGKRIGWLNTEGLLRLWLLVLAPLSYLFFVYNLVLDYRAGGHSWKQGDWLINGQNGPVRRSFAGDVILPMSDALAMDPVLLVIVVQVVVVALVYVLSLRLALSAGGAAPLILALSPAFFMAFWVTDPLGSARKEMLAFAALLLFAQGVIRPSLVWTALGCALFLVAAAAHEALLLFLPVFWGVLCLAPGTPGARGKVVLLSLTSTAALLLFLSAMGSSRVEDFMTVCAPLLERGVAEHMCQGAIRWLEYDAVHGFDFVYSRTTPELMFWFLLAYAASVAPFAYVAYLTDARRLCAALIILPFLLFLPLFAVSTDHGRWISFHVFAAFLLFAVAIRLGRVRLVRRLNAFLLTGLFVAAQLIAPMHVRDVYFGGPVARVWEEARALLP
ncbi:hypothetical protein AIOL_000066 [Candidatus Rhodobacter oscarellae]|uniref:Uncharacterized protein n=1 Tax=Candidatus Rhodobacter oscarellae TaxID=1675527 RepID=A0A0J9EAV9_9RHOB|nr:hypothetical protein [Candidatus Rhodobacter lobularis]KMW59917.1 hypothetical protein AIOL_000066 [Candidatus Rhodobacter lobularis]